MKVPHQLNIRMWLEQERIDSKCQPAETETSVQTLQQLMQVPPFSLPHREEKLSHATKTQVHSRERTMQYARDSGKVVFVPLFVINLGDLSKVSLCNQLAPWESHSSATFSYQGNPSRILVSCDKKKNGPDRSTPLPAERECAARA